MGIVGLIDQALGRSKNNSIGNAAETEKRPLTDSFTDET